MTDAFTEEVKVNHEVANPKFHVTDHPGGPPASVTYTRVVLTAEPAHVVAGGDGGDGGITVAAKDGQPMAELIASDKEAVVWAGQKKGRPGRLTLYDGNGQPAVNLTSADGGRVSLYDGTWKETIRLDAAAGDIALFNADCAEEFDVAEGATVEPGSVVVLDSEGALRPSEAAYDTRVTGVISGAGELKPAIVLDGKGREGRLAVALVGKVFCKVDASPAAVRVGDLLTTSTTPGHAMKATDPGRAFGAVIGKALRALQAGTGLIPVLVALQ